MHNTNVYVSFVLNKKEVKKMLNNKKLFLLISFLTFCNFCFAFSDTVQSNINKGDIQGTNFDPLNMNSISSADLFSGYSELTQFKPVKITNSANTPFIIKTPAETIEIASNSTQEVILKESVVDYFYEGKQRTVTIKENQTPNMVIQSMVNMQGENVKLSMIQRVTSYRITIKDDFAEQLDVKINGPVKWKLIKNTNDMLVIDITLDAYSTRSEFETSTSNSDQDEYTSFFQVTVKDLYAPHKLAGNGFFRFTEW